MTEPAQLFSDRYHRLYKLGQGGMGQVWKCHDRLLDIEVALKILIENASDISKRRFQTEAKALAKLKHKNIVGILDFGVSENGDLYMVMDYVPGQDLKDLIEQKGKLTVEETLLIVCQICDGLRKAHKNNLIHRDIKPSNILITENVNDQYLVKIVDFGTVRSSSVNQFETPDGSVIGSPLYMSPEAAKGETVDARSDVYSLGCLIFECLSGDVPFRGDTPRLTLMMHVNEPAPELVYEGDPFLKKVVENCLHKDPDERYQSVEELLCKLIDYFDSLKEFDFEASKEETATEVLRPIFTPAHSSLIGLCLIVACCFAGILLSRHMEKEAANLDKPEKKGLVFRKPLIMEPQTLKVFDDKFDGMATIIESKNGLIKCSRNVTDDLVRDYLDSHEDTGHWKFGHSQITDDSVKLVDIDKLKFIDLGSTAITDKSIELLSNAKNLNYLDIRNCFGVHLDGFKRLKKLKNLESISIGGRAVDSRWLDVISSMKSLQSVTYKGALTAKDLRKLRGLNKLVRLVLESPSHEVVIESTKLPVLVYLTISGTLDANSLKTLSQSNIQYIDIGEVNLNGISGGVYLSKIDGPKEIVVPYALTERAILNLKANNQNVKITKGKESNSF